MSERRFVFYEQEQDSHGMGLPRFNAISESELKRRLILCYALMAQMKIDWKEVFDILLHGEGKEEPDPYRRVFDIDALQPDPWEEWLDDMPSGPNYFDSDAQWRDQMLDWFRKMPRGK